uniref:Uncharacterized protein n=1 Tax=Ixodes ricinus TaxID=34613 RepID=V5IK39_IXORI
MALQQGSRAAKSLAKFLPNLSGVRFSGSGEWGSGSGKGVVVVAASVTQEEPSARWRLAREEEYFRKLQAKQFSQAEGPPGRGR